MLDKLKDSAVGIFGIILALIGIIARAAESLSDALVFPEPVIMGLNVVILIGILLASFSVGKLKKIFAADPDAED